MLLQSYEKTSEMQKENPLFFSFALSHFVNSDRWFQVPNNFSEDIRVTKKDGGMKDLALLRDGGYPYAVPISYVYDDGKLYFHSALAGHKVDAIRACDKASFCVIDQDNVKPAEYTTYFRSVIAFGRIHIVEDEEEKLAIARILGNKYNPHQEEALQKELEHGLSRMLAIHLDIEHLTGKEAIELVKRRTTPVS